MLQIFELLANVSNDSFERSNYEHHVFVFDVNITKLGRSGIKLLRYRYLTKLNSCIPVLCF